MSSICPFCAKLQRLQTLPDEEIVWQFPHSVAFLGPWQYHLGYCLLVSRMHATELHQLPALERHTFLEEMILLAQAIEKTFKPRKMNYELLGNQVPHLHWHLFPRQAEDPDTLKAVWLALEQAERDESVKTRLQNAALTRSEITGALRATLQKFHASTL